MKTTSAPKKSIRPMPRPTEKRMGEMRDRVKETAEMDRLEGLITGGTESKAIAQDLKAARSVSDADVAKVKKAMPNRIRVTGSGGKNPGANLKPIVKKAGGMVGYKNGGCVMSGRGGKYKGEM